MDYKSSAKFFLKRRDINTQEIKYLKKRERTRVRVRDSKGEKNELEWSEKKMTTETSWSTMKVSNQGP